MENLKDEEIDFLFTMLMAAATDTDPFEMEQELKNEGLIKHTIGLTEGE